MLPVTRTIEFPGSSTIRYREAVGAGGGSRSAWPVRCATVNGDRHGLDCRLPLVLLTVSGAVRRGDAWSVDGSQVSQDKGMRPPGLLIIEESVALPGTPRMGGLR